MLVEMFNKAAQDREQGLIKSNSNSFTAKAVRVPVFDSQLLSTDNEKNYYAFPFLVKGSKHRPLSNTAVLSLSIGFAYDVLITENEERKAANKKIKKVSEKYALIPFDCQTVHTIAVSMCEFPTSQVPVKRIKDHIKSSLKRHEKLKFSVSDDFPYLITGFTAKDACSIFSV